MSFLMGMLMGLAYVLPPGPVTVETVRRSVQGGARLALAVQLGAVTGDLLYAVLVVTCGGGSFLTHPELRAGLGLLGAMLLIHQGVLTLRDRALLDSQITGRQIPATQMSHQRAWYHHAASGLMLALVNPYALMFWLAIGGTGLDSSATSLVSFFIGSLLASVFTALVAGQLHTHGTLRFARRVWVGCGGVLILLGVQLGYSTLAAVWLV